MKAISKLFMVITKDGKFIESKTKKTKVWTKRNKLKKSSKELERKDSLKKIGRIMHIKLSICQ
jgi:hypothetical protein